MKLNEYGKPSIHHAYDMNAICVFIPVSDTESWADWDNAEGCGGADQIDHEDGIIVSKKREKEFRQLVAKFEKRQESFERRMKEKWGE